MRTHVESRNNRSLPYPHAGNAGLRGTRSAAPHPQGGSLAAGLAPPGPCPGLCARRGRDNRNRTGRFWRESVLTSLAIYATTSHQMLCRHKLRSQKAHPGTGSNNLNSKKNTVGLLQGDATECHVSFCSLPMRHTSTYKYVF